MINHFSEPTKRGRDDAREKIRSLHKANTKSMNKSKKKPKIKKIAWSLKKEHVGRRKKGKWEFADPISSIQSLLGEEQHIPIKTTESSKGTYI